MSDLPQYKFAMPVSGRDAGAYPVTLSLDQVAIKQMIHVSELLHFLASVNDTWCASTESGVRVFAENIRRQTKRHTNSCYFTTVAMSEQGAPLEIEP